MAIFPESKESLYGVPGSGAEYRLRLERAAEERAALRASELAAQASPSRDVEERIRIWERLHALRLPRATDHVLLNVIATQTRSTIGQVHDEQRRRATMIVHPQAVLPEGGAVSQSEATQTEVLAVLPRHG